MKLTEIRSELFKAVDKENWQSVRHLMIKLKKENVDLVLTALLEIFFSESYYRYQKIAGGFLWKLKPKYKRNLREDIKRSLKNWDVSVEELPWYFAEVAGLEEVQNTAKLLLSEPLDDIEKRGAETYIYWLSTRNPQEFKTELNNQWNGRLRG